MLTKTQLGILELFASQITEKFSIKQISELTKKPYPLIHRSTQALIKAEYLMKDKQGYISLNYKKNYAQLAFVESLRADTFLQKNKTVKLFVKDALEELPEFFTLLIFGSAVVKKTPRDIDVLCIVPDKQEFENTERVLNNIVDRFTKEFDINVITAKSAREMLSKREELNVMNETLNQHIILFGAENYYRIINDARQ